MTGPDSLPAIGEEWKLPRREVLKRLGGGIAAGAMAPGLVSSAAKTGENNYFRALSALAGRGESYWEAVRDQFPVRPGYIMMNAANLCPTHYAVLGHFNELTRDREGDVSFQNRGKFRETQERSRQLLAAYVGADPDEVAITRNTSESNNTVITGLQLGPGDEVLIWDQNHPSNNIAWKVRAQRYGFTVREVATPERPAGPEQLYNTFINSLSGKTRMLAASHVSNVTGVGLPIREICRECRNRDVLTLVDGAQTLGALALDLHDMGCDFFTGSLHKWPMGPKETGLLYVRRGLAKRVWPSVVTLNYEKIDPDSAAKFDNHGQRDDAIVAAVATAIEFHNTVGRDRIEARLRRIIGALMEGIADIPGSTLLTPRSPDMNAGIVVFALPGISGREAFARLYQQYHVACAPNPVIDGIRLSPHIYNTMADVDKVLTALKTLAV